MLSKTARKFAAALLVVAIAVALPAHSPILADGEHPLKESDSDYCSKSIDGIFKHACYHHDACLRYWAPLKIKTDYECDTEFYNDLVKACNKYWTGFWNWYCRNTSARLYRIGGGLGTSDLVPWHQIKSPYHPGGSLYPFILCACLDWSSPHFA